MPHEYTRGQGLASMLQPSELDQCGVGEPNGDAFKEFNGRLHTRVVEPLEGCYVNICSEHMVHICSPNYMIDG